MLVPRGKQKQYRTSNYTLEIIKQPVFYGNLFCRFKATMQKLKRQILGEENNVANLE